MLEGISERLKMNIFRNVFVNPTSERPTVPGAQEQSMFMSIAVGLFVAVGGFIFGYDTGLINSISEMKYVRQHYASNGENFSARESSIMTAILSLGTFSGAITAPLISDTLGRKIAIIIATFIVFMIGNTCQIASTGLKLFCVGRFITGVSVGIISAVVPLYQAEASPKYARGAIISTYQWTITWGLLVSSAVSQGTHSLNSSASYRIPIGLQYLWSLILGIGMLFLPETPRFYVKKDDLFSAAKSLSILRRVPTNDPGLIEELVEIKAAFDYETSCAGGKSGIREFLRSDDTRPHQLKRILTGVLLQALQQCSGINFIFYYGVNFFSAAGVSQSYIVSLITYAVNVAATIPGIIFVETVGRRKVLVIGGISMTCSSLIIAIVGCTTDSDVKNKVLVAFVCTFITSFAASWAPVVWVVSGEIFSLNVRGKAVALSAATNWLVNFAFAYGTPYLTDDGVHATKLGTNIFFMWAGFNLTGTIVAYFLVYETRGLTLEQIDDLYRDAPNAMNSTKYQVHIRNNAGNEERNNSEENEISLDSYMTIDDDHKNNEETKNNDSNEFSTNIEYKDYAINLGYGLGLQKRGVPSLLTVTTDGSEERKK